ncbi:MAG: ATP-dependent Clp protease proteolytic subunit [Clostridia bacterium]|nr:ATP-dependent Clp protease proteolytic subunit [Clostridia bacterium]
MSKEFLSDEYLLNKGQVYIFGPIDDALAARVIVQMHYIDEKLKEIPNPADRVLTCLINSVGGSVSAGLAIYDTMNNLNCEVRCIATGLAASMGAFLLSSGSYGKRFALPNAEIMIHQPLSSGIAGQASDIILAARHIERTRATLNEILALNTGRTVEEIARDTDRDNVMSAAEAVEYGLIDGILMPKTVKARRSN